MTKPKPAPAEKPRTIDVPLAFPVEITIEGEGSPRTYTSLTLRRMKGKDSYVAESESNKIKAGYLMFAALAGVPLAVIEELDMEDLAAVGEAAAKMMGKRLQDMVGLVTAPGTGKGPTGATP